MNNERDILAKIKKICKATGWMLKDIAFVDGKIESIRFKLKDRNVFLLLTDEEFIIHSADNTMIDLVDIAFIQKMKWFVEDCNA